MSDGIEIQGSEVFRLDDGNVRAWIEQEAIHLVAVDRGDPVELTADMAIRLANALLEMANKIND